MREILERLTALAAFMTAADMLLSEKGRRNVCFIAGLSVMGMLLTLVRRLGEMIGFQ